MKVPAKNPQTSFIDAILEYAFELEFVAELLWDALINVTDKCPLAFLRDLSRRPCPVSSSRFLVVHVFLRVVFHNVVAARNAISVFAF